MLLSLAYQVAEKIPDYRRSLVSLVLKSNLSKGNLINYNLMDIFNTLLKEPLASIKKQRRQYVIVIDALDECQPSGKHKILNCIQLHFWNLPTWLRFFITTRPEVPIKNKLQAFNPVPIEAKSKETKITINVNQTNKQILSQTF